MAKKKMTAREWCVANIDRYKSRDAFIRACVKAVGCNAGRVRTLIAECFPKFQNPSYNSRRKGNQNTVSEPPTPSMGTIVTPKKGSKNDIVPAAEFLASIDIVGSVIKFLDEEVGSCFIENEALRRRFGIGREKWKEMTSLPVFDGRSFTYTNKDGKRVTEWSSVKGIEKAKKVISMACYD